MHTSTASRRLRPLILDEGSAPVDALSYFGPDAVVAIPASKLREGMVLVVDGFAEAIIDQRLRSPRGSGEVPFNYVDLDPGPGRPSFSRTSIHSNKVVTVAAGNAPT